MASFFPFGLTAQADTLILQAAPVGVQRWAAISVIAIAIFLIFVVVALTYALVEVRRLTRKISESVGRIEPGVHPVLERARGVTENVEHITALVRKDVDRVTESVQAVTGRLNQAAARMEERIEEFNAVVEVVQAEAEGIFLDTASTARGVRAGALTLGAPVSEPPTSAPPPGDYGPPSGAEPLSGGALRSDGERASAGEQTSGAMIEAAPPEDGAEAGD